MSCYVNVLELVREKIAKEENWCRKCFSTDSSGIGCDPCDPRACRFCLAGAFLNVGLWAESNTEGFIELSCDQRAINDAYDEFSRNLMKDKRIGIVHFNDNHTHAEVLKYLDEQIAKESL